MNKKKEIDYVSYILLAVIVAITVLAYPEDLHDRESVVKIEHVFYYGWITAISTGLGALPFFFFSDTSKFWKAISNAIAGGMMLSASYSLASEGAQAIMPDTNYGIVSFLNIAIEQQPLARTISGIVLGGFFIIIMQKSLEKFDGISIGELEGASAQKMILIMIVMTLHSISEGIGIGVSFGGSSGKQLGQFISLSLAVHNVPEGLAVALVLTSRKVSKLRSVLWAIFTSLPQPIMAIPVFLYVKRFAPLLPVGLGFASGAMTYVAIFELLSEAIEDSSILTASIFGTAACIFMTVLQELVKGAT